MPEQNPEHKDMFKTTPPRFAGERKTIGDFAGFLVEQLRILRQPAT